MKKQKWLWFILGLLVAVTVSLLSSPKFRSVLFLKLYAERIETSLSIDHGVPADDALLFGYQSVNTWGGEHTMTEFIIMSRGDTYYGVYYSPDDIPVAFQNTFVELTQVSQDYWVWREEGDNHGAISKMQKHWYYFEASF